MELILWELPRQSILRTKVWPGPWDRLHTPSVLFAVSGRRQALCITLSCWVYPKSSVVSHFPSDTQSVHRGIGEGVLFNVFSHTCICSLGVGFMHDCFFSNETQNAHILRLKSKYTTACAAVLIPAWKEACFQSAVTFTRPSVLITNRTI